MVLTGAAFLHKVRVLLAHMYMLCTDDVVWCSRCLTDSCVVLQVPY